MRGIPIRMSRSSTPPRPMSLRACANSPAARAPTSSSTRSAIPISRPRTNRWRLRGRQILIAAVDRIVPFNILEFYRGQHTYVGIDTLGLSSVATGAVLKGTRPRLRRRTSQAVPDQAECDLSAGAGQGGIYRRGRIVARSRHPASLGISLHGLRFSNLHGNKSLLPGIGGNVFVSRLLGHARDSFSASADRGRTDASNVIAARKLHPI